MQHFLFLMKMSITAISFYWRKDKPNFCHLTEFIPKSVCLVSTLPCLSRLVCHTLLFVYFFKELVSFIDYLNPFPNKPCFLRVCSTSPLKTLREKKKLLVMSNLFFSHSVFYPFIEISAIFIKHEIVVCKLFQFGPVQNLSLGKG